MLQHYIRWLFYGPVFAEISDEPVPYRSFPQKIPEKAHGFKFFSMEIELRHGERFFGSRKHFSPTVYFGEVVTYDQVKTFSPIKDYDNLLWNMEFYNINQCVKTKYGNFFPLKNGDKVIAHA